MSEDEQAVLGRIEVAIGTLSDNTKALTERIDVTARVNRRTRVLQVVIAIVVIAVIIFGTTQWHRVTGAIDGNSANAISVCENSNESRAAALELWDYVLDLTKASADASSKTALDKIEGWIAVLYEPHDCSDLSRKYDIPPPPVLQ